MTFPLWQAVLKPFPLLMWVLGLALLIAWRRSPRPRRRWWLVLSIYAVLLLDTLPLTARLTTGWLERIYPPMVGRPEKTRAIVVLSAGVILPAHPGAPTSPDATSYARTMRGWDVYRAGPPCPIIVTGGKDPHAPGAPAAVAMANLLRSVGVPEADILVEAQARTTAENAKYSVQLLRERGIDDGVVIVTTATHLWRSEQRFRREGLAVTPIGCEYYGEVAPKDWQMFWPTGTAVIINQQVGHELLGLAWHWLRGN